MEGGKGSEGGKRSRKVEQSQCEGLEEPKGWDADDVEPGIMERGQMM